MRKILRNTPIVILLAALLLAACTTETQAPAEAPTVTVAEVVPTATTAEVEPTATPDPTTSGDPAEILGEPDGVDTFDNADNWTLFDNQCFKSEITDGKYIMTAKGLPGIVCWEVSWPMIKDFYNEITIEMPDQCQPDDRFGLLFRAPDNLRGYLYGLTCDGRYTMTMWDGDVTTVLVEPSSSEVIMTGPEAVNRIGVLAYGDRYYLYANGVFLAEAQDATFLQEGKLGLYVRTATEQPFVVSFDNLGVWVLDDAYYPPESSSPPPAEELPPPEDGAATVTTFTYVNVRSGPGTQYPIYFVASPGSTGQAVGISQDGAWYAVSLPTTISGAGTGWLSATYVIPENTEGLPVLPAPPPPPVEVPPPDGTEPTVTNFEPLNVRSGPGNEYPSYGVAPIGSSAPVFGISEDSLWYAIFVSTDYSPEGTGWVHTDYVTLSNPSGVEIPVISNPDQLPPVSPPPPGEGSPTVTAIDVINVRNGPSSQCESYGVASIGASAVATGINADYAWYQIQISTDAAPDGIGWVKADFVTGSNTENLPVAVSQYCP